MTEFLLGVLFLSLLVIHSLGGRGQAFGFIGNFWLSLTYFSRSAVQQMGTTSG
ncbi:MAG: hypothetical protein KDK55_05440 [Chlamydiia bacterium]|nr:hypothetical protein [Chlamydiia bacterium]